MKYTEIKSFEDACKAQNIDPNNLPDVSALPEQLGQYIVNSYKLAIIVAAINEDWIPDYKNRSQRKWEPWFYIEDEIEAGSGSGFSFADSGYACTLSDVGARLVFESKEKCNYAANTFLDLYEKVQMIA